MTAPDFSAIRSAASGAGSPLGRAWDHMDTREREFWLRGIGGKFMAARIQPWERVPLEVKEALKVVLPKVARRAALIVEGQVQ